MTARPEDPGDSGANRPSDEGLGDRALAVTPLPSDRLVPRRDVAEILETSESSVRRMEKKGVLRATGERADGAKLFDVEQVRQVERREVRSRTAPPPDDRYDSETAAEAFQLFRDLGPVDVVIRMRLHPAAVAAMFKQWVALQGGYVITHEVARQISEIRGRAIVDADGLLNSLKETPRLGETHCCDCKRELFGAGICRTCAREMRDQEAELGDAAAATQRARDAELREVQRILRAHDDTVENKRKRART